MFSWRARCSSSQWRISITRGFTLRLNLYGKSLTANSETKQKTLEEIAAAFGDRVIVPDEREVDEEELKSNLQHAEEAGKNRSIGI